MATVTEKKLAYLQGTKEAIKAALIEKGQAVSDTDTFRSYADKVAAIKTGAGGGTDVTIFPNVEIELDFTGGDMLIDAGEGYAVRTATIFKPETLIPENIKAGVTIAGIEGTHEGGGGGSSADVRYVTFRNESTGEEFKKAVATGDDCVDVVAKGLWKTPTQESTDQYDFTFYGWGAEPGGAADANILKNITEDKTVYAVFTATLRMYTITWLDSDGVTELPGQKQWAYGTVPSYTPTKENDTFEYWTPTPVEVTGDASYVAKWAGEISGTLNDGAIKWSIANDTLTFTGTGDIPAQGRAVNTSGTVYIYGTSPWYPHREKFSKVVVGEGITKLGAYMLYGQTSGTASYDKPLQISDIYLPSTLTGTWWTDAFGGCELVNAHFAEGITVVGGFGGKKTITAIELPQSLTRIHSNAFMNCTNLTSATFKNTTGWWVSTDSAATSGKAVTVTNKSTAAKYLRETYGNYYWYRT